MNPAGRFGVYVHVPFCLSRCDYCAFATWTDRHYLMDPYVDACAAAARRLLDPARPATSVYFGGGTPSLLAPVRLGSILAAVPRSADAEVTVECNPDTVDRGKLAAYREVGVTRLSFGVQSMSAATLASLGRSHDPAAVLGAVGAAGQAGFGASFNVDLIFGATGESVGDWAATLEAVLALQPAPVHVSAYALTVEAGTPLARAAGRHPDSDDLAEKYLLASETLEGAGFGWYEISNWARPGAECAHNWLYWCGGEYLGVGCAAHSHRALPEGRSRRWWNLRTPDRYIRAVSGGGDGEAAGEDLDPATRRREALELALRTRAGVPADALPGWDTDEVLSRLVRPGDPGRLVLNPEGRLLANEVAIRLAG